MNKTILDERDADLGYIKKYAEELHKRIQSGKLSTYSSDCIRQAYSLLQNAVCEDI
jgi:hypothetical protein